MKHFFLFTCWFCFFFLFPKGDAFTQPLQYEHLIEEFENGKIDWSAQYIEAQGKVYINENVKPRERAIDLAVEGAKAVARAKIVEAFADIRVTSNVRVEDLMDTKTEVSTYLSGTLRRSKMVGKPIVNDNSVEVTIRIPLYKNGLTDELIKRTAAIEMPKIEDVTFPEPYKNTDNKRQKIPVQSLVLPVGDSAAIALSFPNGEYQQSLFPVVVDENGTVIIDMSKEYGRFKKQYGNYVDVATEILKEAGAKKAVEVIDAVQDSNGVIHINTTKQPKVNRWLKTLKKVGSIALPILLSFL